MVWLEGGVDRAWKASWDISERQKWTWLDRKISRHRTCYVSKILTCRRSAACHEHWSCTERWESLKLLGRSEEGRRRNMTVILWKLKSMELILPLELSIIMELFERQARKDVVMCTYVIQILRYIVGSIFCFRSQKVHFFVFKRFFFTTKTTLRRWFVLQSFGVYYDDYMRSVDVSSDECRWRRLFIYIRQAKNTERVVVEGDSSLKPRGCRFFFFWGWGVYGLCFYGWSTNPP